MKVNTVYNGDCLDPESGLAMLPDNSIDLILIDPPYMNIVNNQWDKFTKKDYLNLIKNLSRQFRRILSDSGSLYIFGDDKNIAYWQVIFDKNFNFLNHLIWHKYNLMTAAYKDGFRMFAPVTERILFYERQANRTGLEKIKLDVNNFASLRKYFEKIQGNIDTTKKAIIEKIGQAADHCFRWNSTQFDLPTFETYQALIDIFKIDEFPFFKDYSGLKREYYIYIRGYEAERIKHEESRRAFNIPDIEIIKMPVIDKNSIFHPTTKPAELIRKLIETSSKKGDIVLDCFMGSGSTAISAIRTGRRFIGWEKEKSYYDIILKRISEEKEKHSLFPEQIKHSEPEQIEI